MLVCRSRSDATFLYFTIFNRFETFSPAFKASAWLLATVIPPKIVRYFQIVFLTMVYYLLSASRDRWLPMEWASRLMSFTTYQHSSDGYSVTAAIEHAILYVF